MKHVRSDFPILAANAGLRYLDSTASSLKPTVVIEAEAGFYRQHGVNVHRGVYALSQSATESYESSREVIRGFIHARSTAEIIFTRNTTEAINLVARTFGMTLQAGDVVVLSEMEHHSNIVPWQQLRDERGIELRWIPVTDAGDLDLSALDALLVGAKLVAVTQMSNVLGVVNDVKEIAAKAHAHGALMLVDGAQSVPHMPVDVQDLDCDWLVFSGHKMCGPMGIGVLYGRQSVLEAMPPFLRGGDMILSVTKEAATWNELPWKFEAGTPNAAGAVALGVATQYLQKIGMQTIWEHDLALAAHGREVLTAISGLRLLGADALSPRGAIFSFDLSGAHPHDIGSLLDEKQIAVRAGHHCAQPLHARFGLGATTRASGYLYTTEDELTALASELDSIRTLFS